MSGNYDTFEVPNIHATTRNEYSITKPCFNELNESNESPCLFSNFMTISTDWTRLAGKMGVEYKHENQNFNNKTVKKSIFNVRLW